MERLIFPEIFEKRIIAFFTGKTPGADIDRIAEIASIEKQKIYMPIQMHTDKVLIPESSEPKIADAVISNEKGILIGVQVADCVPILLYDRKRQIIGAVHAGWRGTAAEILKKAIRTMTNRFNSSPADILLALGPSIRWCCYSVGHEVIEAVSKATEIKKIRGSEDKRKEDNSHPLNLLTSQPFFYNKKGGKYCLDLPTANKHQAISVGVLPEHIWMSDECTYCYPDKYYSYRYAKGPTGRQGGFIGIV